MCYPKNIFLHWDIVTNGRGQFRPYPDLTMKVKLAVPSQRVWGQGSEHIRTMSQVQLSSQWSSMELHFILDLTWLSWWFHWDWKLKHCWPALTAPLRSPDWLERRERAGPVNSWLARKARELGRSTRLSGSLTTPIHWHTFVYWRDGRGKGTGGTDHRAEAAGRICVSSPIRNQFYWKSGHGRIEKNLEAWQAWARKELKLF